MIKNAFKWTLLTALSLLTIVSSAQSVRALRINEVQVINETGFVDGYGNRASWIEIYNTSPATVNIGACFLTTDLSNPRMYPIPHGDVETVIPPRQHRLFWADGDAGKGTFHANFTLDPTKANFIALFDSDGKTLIDSITVPAGQVADLSYARKVDGALPWGVTSYVTPKVNNVTINEKGNISFFKTHDPVGIVVTIISMLVVFLSLVVLYIIFKWIGKTAVRMVKNKSIEAGATHEQVAATIDVPGDLHVAIALALYEHASSIHDEESTVITISRVRRRYSPWSSKIHTLREVPHRELSKRSLGKK